VLDVAVLDVAVLDIVVDVVFMFVFRELVVFVAFVEASF
jgi:hypothetical protein